MVYAKSGRSSVVEKRLGRVVEVDESSFTAMVEWVKSTLSWLPDAGVTKVMLKKLTVMPSVPEEILAELRNNE